MVGFSALCLFEAGAITAVFGGCIYTQTQTRHGLTQLDSAHGSVPACQKVQERSGWRRRGGVIVRVQRTVKINCCDLCWPERGKPASRRLHQRDDFGPTQQASR